MEYIQHKDSEEGCVFCKARDSQDDAASLVVYRGQQAYIILNRYPYTSGHVMVVPNAHQPALDVLDAPTRAEMMELANVCVRVLRMVYRPQGFNVGINIGEAGGAGIAAHIHLHVVPRWAGDTNFMASIGMTRILPEALADSYQRLKAAWNVLEEEL